MSYERQHEIAAELDARYPKIKADIGQQMFRSCYYNDRMAGRSPEVARADSMTAVRKHVPGFVPTERAEAPPTLMSNLVARRDTAAIRDSRWMREGSGKKVQH